MAPAPREGHQAPGHARHLLVGAVAVADDDRMVDDRAEQRLRDLRAARGVDVEVDRVLADRGPQPSPARTALLAKRLHAPVSLVAVAHRRLVLVREDRPRHRLEQRHEPVHAAGQRPRRDRKPLAGQPRGDLVQGAEAGIALEQEARPHAGPAGRVGEQARRRERRHFHGRRRAVASPAPPGTADDTLVGPDFDLDDGGDLGAGRHVGLPAAGRRRAHRPAGCALPSSPRARPLLLLAPAPEQRLGQHRPGRAKLRKLDLQPRLPAL